MDPNEEKQKKLNKLVGLVNESEISSIKSVTTGIINIINDPESTGRSLAEIIKIDPPLTAKLLTLANSAHYSSPRKIIEINEAVIWVGFDALKELALSQKVCEIFNTGESIDGYSSISLWKHSVAVALLGKMICRREFREKGENTYVAGLLHDIGIIVEDQFLQDEFRHAVSKSNNEKKNLLNAEHEILGYDHADIGNAITAAWNLPQELVVAIGYHHHPHNAGHTFSRIASTLYVADYVCQDNGIGYRDAPFQSKVALDECLRTLHIQPHAINIIVKDVEQEIQRIEDQGLFQHDPA